jgi:hypothetical protein
MSLGAGVGLPILLLHWYDSPLMIDANQTVVCGSSAAEWFAGIGTIVLAFVAVFQQWLQQLIVRPILRLSARVSRPDAEKTRWRTDTDVYYFRLGVTNAGNKAAHDVQIYLATDDYASVLPARNAYRLSHYSSAPRSVVWSLAYICSHVSIASQHPIPFGGVPQIFHHFFTTAVCFAAILSASLMSQW